MRLETVTRNEMSEIIKGDRLRHGHMLIAIWPRLTDKTVKNENGEKVIVEPAGSLIRRRVILRNDWTKPTKTYEPKGGIMFNVESQEKAAAIRAKNSLHLFLSLEGVSHPHGEPDHPVNVPLAQLMELTDTHSGIMFRVVDN